MDYFNVRNKTTVSRLSLIEPELMRTFADMHIGNKNVSTWSWSIPPIADHTPKTVVHITPPTQTKSHRPIKRTLNIIIIPGQFSSEKVERVPFVCPARQLMNTCYDPSQYVWAKWRRTDERQQSIGEGNQKRTKQKYKREQVCHSQTLQLYVGGRGRGR